MFVKNKNMLITIHGILIHWIRFVSVLVPLALNLSLIPNKIIYESKTTLLKDFYKVSSKRKSSFTPNRFNNQIIIIKNITNIKDKNSMIFKNPVTFFYYFSHII